MLSGSFLGWTPQRHGEAAGGTTLIDHKPVPARNDEVVIPVAGLADHHQQNRSVAYLVS
jgi:hypothetical protein